MNNLAFPSAALISALAALHAGAQEVVVAAHHGANWPWFDSFWGPDPKANYVFPIQSPAPAWVMQNTAESFPFSKPVYQFKSGLLGFSSEQITRMLSSGWRLTSHMSVENSAFDARYPSPYANRGPVVLAYRVTGCLFDLWFSNGPAGELSIQSATKLAGGYQVGPPHTVPTPAHAPWFDLDVIYNAVTKRANVYIDHAPVPGLTNVPVVPITDTDLVETRGLNFGMSSRYGSGKVAVGDLTLSIHSDPVISPDFKQLCPSLNQLLTVSADTFGAVSYVWLHDAQVISGANQSTYLVRGSDADVGGFYTCLVLDDYGLSVANSFIRGCRLDLNCDGQVDLSDFFGFFQCFDAGQPCADLDQDGQVDLSDYFIFFNLFDSQEC